MRCGLQPLGVHSTGFSRLTSARLYATFIRPKLEYGLAVSSLLVRDLRVIERAQDQCLRLAFGGHSKASTVVFKHLTHLPCMKERVSILGFKMLVRMQQLPADTLLAVLLAHIASASVSPRFRWPKLLKNNSLWKLVCHSFVSPSVPRFSSLQQWIATSGGDPKPVIRRYRRAYLAGLLAKPDGLVLLRACRPVLGVDPILVLPMSVWERSRLLRWKMGWLPARPVPCRCGHPHASRNHLLSCLSVASRLGVAVDAQPNPLDFVLNQLPRLPSAPSPNDQRHSVSLLRWSTWWPTICSIMLDMDMICLPDVEFSPCSQDIRGLTLLEWLLPVFYKQVAPPVTSTLYNYLSVV